MEKITWKQFASILSNPVEYMGAGPASTTEDMAKRIDEFKFSYFMPNRTLQRETSKDIVLNKGDVGSSYLQKKGKVYLYKNMAIVFGSDCTVCYRLN